MTRGQKAPPGTVRIAPNGYQYTKTEDGPWRLTHHLIAEQKLGRRLKAHERLKFIDGDRTNLDPDNLEVQEVSAGRHKKIAEIQEKIARLERQLADLLEG